MARIETDPNYTAPTFSRATAGTDLFKKEDVQGLAAAMSAHDHANGKGLAVTRVAAGAITGAAVGGQWDIPHLFRSSDVVSGVPASGSGLELAYSQTTNIGSLSSYNRSAGAGRQLDISGSQINLASTVHGTRLSINTDGSVTLVGATTAQSSLAVGGVAQLNSDVAMGAATLIRGFNAGSALVIYNDTGIALNNRAGSAPLWNVSSVGNVTQSGDTYVFAVRGTTFPTYINFGANADLANASASSINFRRNYDNVPIFIITGDGGFTSGGGNAMLNGRIGMGGVTPQGTYRLSLPNVVDGTGQGISTGWIVYGSVLHAEEYGLSIKTVPEPVSALQAIHPVVYDHTSFDIEGQPLRTKEGDVVANQTVGMHPREVEAVYPQLVGYDTEGTPIGVDYDRLMCVLWAATQEIEARVVALEGGAAKPA